MMREIWQQYPNYINHITYASFITDAIEYIDQQFNMT